MMFALFAMCLATSAVVNAGEEKKVDAALEAKVDNVLKGYNDDDHKVFFADYAKSMAALATEQTFKTMYVNMAKKDFGKYVSKKLIPAQTVNTGDFPLLVYEGEFEKNKKVKISVNFTKEDGNFKIMQVRFDKME